METSEALRKEAAELQKKIDNLNNVKIKRAELLETWSKKFPYGVRIHPGYGYIEKLEFPQPDKLWTSMVSLESRDFEITEHRGHRFQGFIAKNGFEDGPHAYIELFKTKEEFANFLLNIVEERYVWKSV